MPKISYGLLLRWKFAINEMNSFYKIKKSQRVYIINKLQRIIIKTIETYNNFTVLEKDLNIFLKKNRLEDFRKIFLFIIKKNNKYLSLLKSINIYDKIKKSQNSIPLISQPMKLNLIISL